MSNQGFDLTIIGQEKQRIAHASLLVGSTLSD